MASKTITIMAFVVCGLINYIFGVFWTTINLQQYPIPISRNAQRCEIRGETLNCQPHTAWWNGDECSCSINNDMRVSFPTFPQPNQ